MVFGVAAKVCRVRGLREWRKMSSARGNRETGVQMTAGSSSEESCGQEGRRRPSAVRYRCVAGLRGVAVGGREAVREWTTDH
jgi:hypothetical protein